MCKCVKGLRIFLHIYIYVNVQMCKCANVQIRIKKPKNAVAPGLLVLYCLDKEKSFKPTAIGLKLAEYNLLIKLNGLLVFDTLRL